MGNEVVPLFEYFIFGVLCDWNIHYSDLRFQWIHVSLNMAFPRVGSLRRQLIKSLHLPLKNMMFLLFLILLLDSLRTRLKIQFNGLYYLVLPEHLTSESVSQLHNIHTKYYSYSIPWCIHFRLGHPSTFCQKALQPIHCNIPTYINKPCEIYHFIKTFEHHQGWPSWIWLTFIIYDWHL